MGESRAWETYEGRTGPASFAELFKAAARPAHREEALRILDTLDLTEPQELQLRRKLAEAQRAHRGHRRIRAARRDIERIDKLVLEVEASVKRLVAVYTQPPAVLAAAHNLLRELAQRVPPNRSQPAGRPKLPYSTKALADLGFLDAADVRVFLRAVGIPLSTGRRARR